MPGFASNDNIISALSAGQTFKSNWMKQFNPTTAALTNEWHTLFRGGGNPPADALFNTGTALNFQPVKDLTAGASSMPHGGDVQPTFYKYLLAASAVTAAATTVPCVLALVDVVGFYRVTAVTTITAQNTVNTLTTVGQSETFTVDASTDICTYTSTVNKPANILTGTNIRAASTTTLPAGLSAATDYYVIRVSDTAFKFATSYANAIAGIAIDITSTGTGTHTVYWLLPRYTNGAGVQSIFFNSNATALGAGTPNLSLGYTNSIMTAARATPTILPVGKTGASNSLILASGTGAGKYNYATPLQSGDAGISSIQTIQNSTSYVSGEYSVALVKEIAKFPLSTLGLSAERNLLFELPSLPRIYDGAALYWMVGSSTTTPTSANFMGDLTFVWN